MSVFNSFKKFVTDEEETTEIDAVNQRNVYESNSADPNGINASTTIALFYPRAFQEAEEIGVHLINKKACVINLSKMPVEFKQRLIDFLSGVVLAVDGKIVSVDQDSILCSPKNLPVGKKGND